ncbi:hypothetical protein K438DRAFT_1773729 [Mycena galopus ATCC 62051]|nr:hypothetical protein K438DRAFT_1773729 [Mycena galopus ATCC 62051]
MPLPSSAAATAPMPAICALRRFNFMFGRRLQLAMSKFTNIGQDCSGLLFIAIRGNFDFSSLELSLPGYFDLRYRTTVSPFSLLQESSIDPSKPPRVSRHSLPHGVPVVLVNTKLQLQPIFDASRNPADAHSPSSLQSSLYPAINLIVSKLWSAGFALRNDLRK